MARGMCSLFYYCTFYIIGMSLAVIVITYIYVLATVNQEKIRILASVYSYYKIKNNSFKITNFYRCCTIYYYDDGHYHSQQVQLLIKSNNYETIPLLLPLPMHRRILLPSSFFLLLFFFVLLLSSLLSLPPRNKLPQALLTELSQEEVLRNHI